MIGTINFLKTAIKTSFIAFALMLFTLPCYGFDKAYDTEKQEIVEFDFPLPQWPKFSFPIVEVQGTAWALNKENDKWQKNFCYWGQRGSGTVIKHGYVLTAAHLVYPRRVKVHEAKWVTMNTWPYKVESRQIFLRVDCITLFPAWVDYIDKEADIAILAYVPNKVLEPINIDIAFDPSTLDPGDAVAMVTHKREGGRLTSDLEVIYGTVVSRTVYAPFPEVMLYLDPNDFTISIPALPGDSGTAIFAFKQGKPYLIGWLHSGYMQFPEIYAWAGWLADYERFFHVH